jgi:hypothetical protein
MRSFATSSPKLSLMASSSFLGVHFESNLKIPAPFHIRVANVLIDNAKSSFTIRIPFTQMGHDL